MVIDKNEKEIITLYLNLNVAKKINIIRVNDKAWESNKWDTMNIGDKSFFIENSKVVIKEIFDGI